MCPNDLGFGHGQDTNWFFNVSKDTTPNFLFENKRFYQFS